MNILIDKVWSPSRAEASELCDSQGTAEFLCPSECNKHKPQESRITLLVNCLERILQQK